VSALEDDVRRLRDIQEITQLKARCCRLIDTKDWDGYGELLVEDFRLTSDAGTRNSRAEVLALLAGSLAHATTVHHVHMPEITVSGDTATAIWAMNDYVAFPSEGSPFVIRGYGHYHEEYVRTGEGWRVKSSVLERLRVDTDGDLPAAFRGGGG
jgi:SnoaL-like domain